MTEKEREEMMHKNWVAQMNGLGFDESGYILDLKNPIRLEAAPGWISVNDRLPDMAGHMVLVTAHNTNFNYDEVFPAFLSYGTNEWCTYDITKIRKITPADNVIAKYLKITHWMELPEPAKGG